ncbi:MAG: DUF47 domain-containing protein [Methylotenera sp.]|nr:DUF47 domain-containing protein [Oligoflexia bacterium]
MLKNWLPRKDRFYVLFSDMGDLIIQGTAEFKHLLADLPNAAVHAKKIHEIEHLGDSISHTTAELLHTTFITPIDREDIRSLISNLDDILDGIHAAAQRILLFEVTQMPPEAAKMAELTFQAATQVAKVVKTLDNLKDSQAIMKTCVEINRLENEADQILRTALGNLFREEKDLRQLIKLKEIFEILENVSDSCEDCANLIEGIVLEYA